MNPTDVCSILPMTPLALRLRKACNNSEGIATAIPVAVQMRASEIPAANCLGSPLPKLEINLNVAIIPMTVPSKPISGPAVAERSEERRVGKECRFRWSPQLLVEQHRNKIVIHAL